MRGRILTAADVTVPSQHTFADDEWHAHGGPGHKDLYIHEARAAFQRSQQQLRAAGFTTAITKSFTLGIMVHANGEIETFEVGLTGQDGTPIPSLNVYTKFRSLGLFTSGLNNHQFQVDETMTNLLTATQVALGMNITNARRREALRDLVPGTADFPLGWTTITEEQADTMDTYFRECFRSTLGVKRTDVHNALLYAPRGRCGGFGLSAFKDRAHIRMATVFLWGLTSHDRATQIAIHSHLRLLRDAFLPRQNYQDGCNPRRPPTTQPTSAPNSPQASNPNRRRRTTNLTTNSHQDIMGAEAHELRQRIQDMKIPESYLSTARLPKVRGWHPDDQDPLEYPPPGVAYYQQSIRTLQPPHPPWQDIDESSPRPPPIRNQPFLDWYSHEQLLAQRRYQGYLGIEWICCCRDLGIGIQLRQEDEQTTTTPPGRTKSPYVITVQHRFTGRIALAADSRQAILKAKAEIRDRNLWALRHRVSTNRNKTRNAPRFALKWGPAAEMRGETQQISTEYLSPSTHRTDWESRLILLCQLNAWDTPAMKSVRTKQRADGKCPYCEKTGTIEHFMTCTDPPHPQELIDALNARHSASREVLKKYLGLNPDIPSEQQPHRMILIAEEGKPLTLSATHDYP